MPTGDPRDVLLFEPIGAHQSLTPIVAATTLTPAAGATKWMTQAFTQNVRFTLSGTTPTAALGFQLRAGDPAIIVALSNSTIITVIQEAANADLEYQWGR